MDTIEKKPFWLLRNVEEFVNDCFGYCGGRSIGGASYFEYEVGGIIHGERGLSNGGLQIPLVSAVVKVFVEND